MLGIQARLRGKRSLAVLTMTVLLLLVLIIPLSLAVSTILAHTGDIAGRVRSVAGFAMAGPPDWVAGVPLVGPKAALRWQEAVAAGPDALSERLAPHARMLARWVIEQAGSFGLMAVQLLLTVIISAVLYATGEQAGLGIRLFARRLAGQHGEDAAVLAAKAVRGVALGVVVTALIQAVLGGIGLVTSGVPAAAVLTAVMFVLCVAQLGPALVLIPSVVWLFWQNQTVWGSVLLVWSIFVLAIDNVIRPLLIRKGADLPLLLIFAGVIGGLISFGVIGLFIGPVLLAVTYTLLVEWVALGEPPAHPTDDPA
jgi:predicted PurR-regulated permease PerM